MAYLLGLNETEELFVGVTMDDEDEETDDEEVVDDEEGEDLE